MDCVYAVAHLDGICNFDPSTIKLFEAKELAIAYAEQWIKEIMHSDGVTDGTVEAPFISDQNDIIYSYLDHDVSIHEIEVCNRSVLLDPK